MVSSICRDSEPIISSWIRKSNEEARVSFSQTFHMDSNTKMTVTLGGKEFSGREFGEPSVVDKVSAVSSAVISSSSHSLPLSPQDRVAAERQESRIRKTISLADSVIVKPSPSNLTSESSEQALDQNQEESRIEKIEKALKRIPEELNAENFDGLAKMAVQEYNKRRTSFFVTANASLEYIEEVTSDSISKINALADEVINLGVFLKVIELIPGELNIKMFVGLAKSAVEEYHRQRIALIESANAKLRDVSNINITLKDAKEIIDRVTKLKNYREIPFKLNKQLSFSQLRRSSPRVPKYLVKAKTMKEVDEKKSNETATSINVAGVNVQIITDRRNAIIPEIPFSQLTEVEREKLKKIS